MIENKNISIYRQDKVRLRFTLEKENEETGEYEALDLSGKSGRIFFTAKRDIDSDDSIIDQAVTIDSAVDGECSITLSRDQTLELWRETVYQQEADKQAAACSLVYRYGSDEVTYSQFWVEIAEDIRRV